MTDAEKIALAHQAKTMLENDAFSAAVDAHRLALLARFADSQPGDAAAWGEIHAELRALAGVRAALNGLMADGDATIRRAQLRTIAR